ncbi:hypothetical protein ACFL96_17530 [Thermoproteota archaeon]
MVKEIELKKIERASYRFTFQHGLYDILVGLILIGVGFGPSLYGVFPTPLNFFIAETPAIIVYLLGMRYIINPRMGIVRFGEKRKADKKKLMMIMIGSVFITLIALIWSMASDFQSILFGNLVGWLIIGLLLATLPIATIAYFLDIDRMYVYAVLVGVGIPTIEFLKNYMDYSTSTIIVNGSIGIIFVLNGLILFTRFMQKYPKPEEVKKNGK